MKFCIPGQQFYLLFTILLFLSTSTK